MKSFIESVAESVQAEILKSFEVLAYDRQLLVYIILSLMLDHGNYDYEIPIGSMDSMINYGIAYTLGDNALSVKVIFPEESKKMLGEENE